MHFGETDFGKLKKEFPLWATAAGIFFLNSRNKALRKRAGARFQMPGTLRAPHAICLQMAGMLRAPLQDAPKCRECRAHPCPLPNPARADTNWENYREALAKATLLCNFHIICLPELWIYREFAARKRILCKAGVIPRSGSRAEAQKAWNYRFLWL